MKRVSSFQVHMYQQGQGDLAAFAEPPAKRSASGPQDGSAPTQIRLASWHKTCQAVLDRLSEESGSKREAVVFDSKTKSVLARFSRQNLESTTTTDEEEFANKESNDDYEENTVTKDWDSVAFAKIGGDGFEGGDSIYENRNVRDYHWELLVGAQREVPFRLSYLERNAEKNRFCAFTLVTLQKVKELFGFAS